MSLIAGRYDLDDLPERGSMGEVYTGYDIRLDRRVAVKRLHPDLVTDTEVTKRFEREARLTARVKHPGVPAVFDYGVDDQGPYLVLEFVDGRSLHDLICEIHPLPPDWVAAIGAQIAAVLDNAHAASLIQGDLKPANILLRPDGTIAVIDFGVAAVVGASRLSTLTATGATVGTAAYQAPERRLGIESPLTDLYALGRVLYDLATGTLPDVHLDRPAGLPDGEIAQLIASLTAMRPQDRPADARAVLDRLLPLIGQLDSLPGFVRHPLGHSPAPSAEASEPQGMVVTLDVAHLRRRAERLAAGGRLHQAIDLTDHLITGAVGLPDAVLVDLRWSRTRWLAEAGDHARVATELGPLVGDLVDHLGAQHPAVTSARLMLARAYAARGHAEESVALLTKLCADLAAEHGPHDPALYLARLEIGVQQAVAGDTAAAAATLDALAADQRLHLGPHTAGLGATLDVLAALQAVSRGRRV